MNKKKKLPKRCCGNCCYWKKHYNGIYFQNMCEHPLTKEPKNLPHSVLYCWNIEVTLETDGNLCKCFKSKTKRKEKK